MDRLPARRRIGRAILDDEGDVGYDDDALEALYRLTDGYPYFVQAYGKVAWDAGATAITSAAPTSTDGASGGGGGGRLLRLALRPGHAR